MFPGLASPAQELGGEMTLPRGLDTKSPSSGSLKHPATSELSRSTDGDGDDEARRDGSDNSFHLLRA